MSRTWHISAPQNPDFARDAAGGGPDAGGQGVGRDLPIHPRGGRPRRQGPPGVAVRPDVPRGIETYYAGIINDLGWIQKRQDVAGRDAIEGLTPHDTRVLESGRRPMAAGLIAEQLGDRVSALFSYDKRNGGVGRPAREVRPERLPPAAGDARVAAGRRRERRQPVHEAGQPGRRPGGGAVRGARNRLLVAVVPGKPIECGFPPPPQRPEQAPHTLVDAHMEVITSSNRALEGLNLKSFETSDVLALILDYGEHPKSSTKLFPNPIRIHNVDLGPRLVALAPVTVAGDGRGAVPGLPAERHRRRRQPPVRPGRGLGGVFGDFHDRHPGLDGGVADPPPRAA